MEFRKGAIAGLIVLAAGCATGKEVYHVPNSPRASDRPTIEELARHEQEKERGYMDSGSAQDAPKDRPFVWYLGQAGETPGYAQPGRDAGNYRLSPEERRLYDARTRLLEEQIAELKELREQSREQGKWDTFYKGLATAREAYKGLGDWAERFGEQNVRILEQEKDAELGIRIWQLRQELQDLERSRQ